MHREALVAVFLRSFRTRRDLLFENLALRQQLAVLARRSPRPQLTNSDRLLWILFRSLWAGWQKALVVVQPDTVVRWHKNGFKLYWRWISRHRSDGGRKRVSSELLELISRMVAENPPDRSQQIPLKTAHGRVRPLSP